MKLSLTLLLCLVATSAIVFAQEDVDAEVVDDDAVVEDDDDVIIDEDGEADMDDDAEMPGTGMPEADEVAPQMMPEPMDGVRIFSFFPDGAHSITGGKVSEVIVGVQNNGDQDLEIATISGRMMQPGTQEVVQNFTNVGYDKQTVFSKSEASFAYAIVPHIYTGGREFEITLEVYYKEYLSNLYYRAVPFQETVNVLESTEGVATEIAFLWATIVVIAVVLSYLFYVRVLCKYLGIKPTSKAKVETGTVNENIQMDWIPSGHANLRKRQTSPGKK